MINQWMLPESLAVGGNEYRIRTDFRDIINILESMTDPELDDNARALVFFAILFLDPVPAQDMQEAYAKGVEFINAGIEDDGKPAPTLMDWEQDAPLIIPAINKVAGTEIRALPHVHWWTFMAWYMEIGESTFSNVINIRQKKSKGRKLEDYEREYYRENRKLIDLTPKMTEEEKQEMQDLMKWL